MTDRPISEEYRIVAKKFVDADAAANLLEETKSAVLSQQMMALGDMPVSRAEMQVKASGQWHQHGPLYRPGRQAALNTAVTTAGLRPACPRLRGRGP